MTPREPDDDPRPEGDPVCWLDELCAACGAMPDPERPGRCWRCGAPRGGSPEG